MSETSFNTIPIFRSIFFPCNYAVVPLLLIKYIEHFWSNSKIFAILFAPCMLTGSCQKRFVMNMQLNVLPKPSLSDWKKAKKSQILSGFFRFSKKAKYVEKKSEFQNPASKKLSWQPCSMHDFKVRYTCTPAPNVLISPKLSAVKLLHLFL